MRPTVYLQANQKQLLAARVAAYAAHRSARLTRAFDVQILLLDDFPPLYGREGQTYLRDGLTAVWRNDNLQSFTPLRFVAAQANGFAGRALVIDPDVFAIADLTELLGRDTGGAAIMARRVAPKPGRPDAYWDTSVMLLECGKLCHWDWERQLDDLFARRMDYRQWMTLSLEDQSTIAPLEEEWNRHDVLDERTKVLHNTRMITQPWKTGLPVDFVEVWQARTPRELARYARDRIQYRGKTYEPHPDPRQEQLFFTHLRQALEDGVISEAEVRDAIAQRHIRQDALERARAVA